MVTAAAAADARVSFGSPSKNYGSDSVLRVKSGEYNTHLKFNVTGLTGQVQSVKLRLYVTDGSPVGGTVFATDSGWIESGSGSITWNNAPAMGTQLGSAGAVTAGGWVEINLGAFVQADGTYSVGLTSSSSNSAYYASRESGNGPQLIVQQG